MAREFSTLRAAATSSAASFDAVARLLRHIRGHNLHEPALVVDAAYARCVSPAAERGGACTALGDEYYVVFEQVYTAALECARLDIADEMLARMRARFSTTSERVRRLSALKVEADGRTADALRLYDELLRDNRFDQFAAKRRIALLLSPARPTRESRALAVAALNDYLRVFQSDTEAWQRLGELHADAGAYEAAVHCVEEALLAQPMAAPLHVRLAELLYARAEHAAARDRFAHALTLTPVDAPHAARALWGLLLACRALAERASSRAASAADRAAAADARSDAAASLARSRLLDAYDAPNVRTSAAARAAVAALRRLE